MNSPSPEGRAMADLAQMDEGQRRQADLNASRIGAIAFQLRTGTREGSQERAALAQRAIQALVQQGLIPPEAAQRIDLSDAGLEAIEQQAAMLKGALAQLGARPTAPAKKGGRRALSARLSPYRDQTGASSIGR
jgi:hypothetical protein